MLMSLWPRFSFFLSFSFSLAFAVSRVNSARVKNPERNTRRLKSKTTVTLVSSSPRDSHCWTHHCIKVKKRENKKIKKFSTFIFHALHFRTWTRLLETQFWTKYFHANSGDLTTIIRVADDVITEKSFFLGYFSFENYSSITAKFNLLLRSAIFHLSGLACVELEEKASSFFPPSAWPTEKGKKNIWLGAFFPGEICDPSVISGALSFSLKEQR